jgi:hypothetical protein
MNYFLKTDYTLKGFEKSKRKYKKYDAILLNKINKKIYLIPFGDSRYQQYKDDSGLHLYSHLDHGDKKRRDSYKNRHAKDVRDGYYSAGYFSMNYLW